MRAHVFAAERIHADDTTDILLRFRSGPSGHVFCSVAATPNYRTAVYGTEAFAEVLGHTMTEFRLLPAVPGEYRAAATPEVTRTEGFNMLTAELEAFAASVASGVPFPTKLTDILHGVEVFEAVLRSAASGRPEALR